MNKWHLRLGDHLQRKGWSQVEFSDRAGVSVDSVRKYLRGDVAQPRGDSLAKLANCLGVHLLWLRDGIGPEISRIPVVGYIGAGESFVPIDDLAPGAGHEYIEMDLAGADPIAVEVRGNSMLPVYRPGDSLLCSRMRGADLNECYGLDCVVLTASGEGYVKSIVRGSEPGTYTLVSYNDRPIENVRLVWAAPIVWVRRARASGLRSITPTPFIL